MNLRPRHCLKKSKSCCDLREEEGIALFCFVTRSQVSQASLKLAAESAAEGDLKLLTLPPLSLLGMLRVVCCQTVDI